MPFRIEKVDGEERVVRAHIDQLDGGWSTYTYPHLLAPNELYVADNVVYYQKGLIQKRPGNSHFGFTTAASAASGHIGTGTRVLSMTRYYPASTTAAVAASGILIAQSGTQLWRGNDATGTFTAVGGGQSFGPGNCTYAQMYDASMSTGAADALFICDGTHVPRVYDGVHCVPVTLITVGASSFLPMDTITSAPITPKYVCNWGPSLVYAGTVDDAVFISDSLSPETFTGNSFVGPGGTYFGYWPAGRSGNLGPVTGITALGPLLIIFYYSGVVVGYNSGTYGALQFQFYRISNSIGCVAPMSIVSFDNYVVFFGGDGFYATDGQSIARVPDKIPTVYDNNAVSVNPPEIKVQSTVSAVRHQSRYWASYDSTGSGVLDTIVVFDRDANNGWSYGAKQGGAWTRWRGMSLACAVYCVGPGDTQQVFWGSSLSDLVFQHDCGTYDDVGTAIQVTIQGKSFFFDQPINPKTVNALYFITAYSTLMGAFTSNPQPYVVTDTGALLSTVSPPITVQPTGTLYGQNTYGSFVYNSGNVITEFSSKSFVQAQNLIYSVAPAITETSIHPFGLIAFVIECIIDPPPR